MSRGTQTRRLIWVISGDVDLIVHCFASIEYVCKLGLKAPSSSCNSTDSPTPFLSKSLTCSALKDFMNTSSYFGRTDNVSLQSFEVPTCPKKPLRDCRKRATVIEANLSWRNIHSTNLLKLINRFRIAP